MISRKLRNDIILIGAFLAVALIVLFAILFFKSEGAYAVVMVDGKETATYPLSSDTEVKLQNGDGYNILVIEDGKARIKEASCPDKLCVKQHEVMYNGETLVCLPNKTTVKIVSEIESETDFIS